MAIRIYTTCFINKSIGYHLIHPTIDALVKFFTFTT